MGDILEVLCCWEICCSLCTGDCDCDCDDDCCDCDCCKDNCCKGDCCDCCKADCCHCDCCKGDCCEGPGLCQTLCFCHMCDSLWDSCYYVHTDAMTTSNTGHMRRRPLPVHTAQYITQQPQPQTQPNNKKQTQDQNSQQQEGLMENVDTITTQPASLGEVQPMFDDEVPPPSYEEAVLSQTQTDKV